MKKKRGNKRRVPTPQICGTARQDPFTISDNPANVNEGRKKGKDRPRFAHFALTRKDGAGPGGGRSAVAFP